MAVNPVALQPGITLGSSSAVLVTGSSAMTVVTQALFVNPTSSAISLSASVARNGAQPLFAIPSRQIGPGATNIAPEFVSFPLAQGDEITASGNGLIVFLNGFTVSS